MEKDKIKESEWIKKYKVDKRLYVKLKDEFKELEKIKNQNHSPHPPYRKN